ncbi:MAG TPA: nitroreductase family protein [Anaerolineales bacterium]|nr:nitroreductase family protein [Anaerolineales bacterium]
MSQPPLNQTRADFVAAVDHVIRERKTLKVLRDPGDCADLPFEVAAQLRAAVRESLEVAGWAPFHKPAHKETHLQGGPASIVPWRFYVLEKPALCALLKRLRAQALANPDSKWSRAWETKITRVIAGTGALVMTTWLPDPGPDGGAPVLNENNQEHIAAASAAIQNLMLAAEARGLQTYWSTGGILNDGEVFDWLGIPRAQKLAGAVFLAPTELPGDAFEGGSWRDKRGGPAEWSIWVDADRLAAPDVLA